jgi:hypothetical protein
MSDRASEALVEGFPSGELEHTIPYQNVKRSLSLPSVIVNAGGARSDQMGAYLRGTNKDVVVIMPTRKIMQPFP